MIDLATFYVKDDLKKGKVDNNLSIKIIKNHTLLVQVYVDDIIFGSTNKELCEDFPLMMK